VDIAGTVVAPVPYAGVQLWIVFQNVDGVTINGGTLDGRGQAYWACRRAGGGSSCPVATRVSQCFLSDKRKRLMSR
jgi:polygalacturonase